MNKETKKRLGVEPSEEAKYRHKVIGLIATIGLVGLVFFIISKIIN